MRTAHALAFVTLLLLATLPVPNAAAAGPYAVSATLTPESGGTYLQAHTLSYDADGPIRWTRPVPADSTFLRAYDESGNTLSATLEGAKITVETRNRGQHAFTLEFRSQAKTHGPYLEYTADLASATDSPTRAQLVTSGGHTRVGWRGSENGQLADDGVFRATGPLLASFLALPPGANDSGPDLRTSGHTVLRTGEATVRPEGVTLDLTIVYDTDVYGPEWSLIVPEGARVTAARTPNGPATFGAKADGRIVADAGYPFGFHLGPRNLTITYEYDAPESYGGAYLRTNLSIASGDDTFVSLNVTLPQGASYTGTRLNGAHETSPLRFVNDGPIAVSVAYLPETPSGMRLVEEGAYRILAGDDLIETARAAAREATRLLPSAAGFVGGAAITKPFHVAYTDAPVFDWETGFYTPGYDTISIRASTLRTNATAEGRLPLVQTLVHETTHGLVARHLPDVPGGASFFEEGLARLAETHVEGAYDTDALFRCEKVGARESCTRHTARPTATIVHDYHRAAKTLDIAWSAGNASDADRGFLYDYSGLVFHAYERRAAPGALTHVLNRMALVKTDDRAAFGEALMDAFLLQAPDLTRDAILYPGRTVAQYDDGAFAACLGPLAAPPYPWEGMAAKPAQGCGDLELASKAGEAPPAPPGESLPEPPAPAVLPDLPEAPPEPAGGPGDGTATAAEGRTGAAPIPGLPVMGVVLLLALVALRRR